MLALLQNNALKRTIYPLIGIAQLLAIVHICSSNKKNVRKRSFIGRYDSFRHFTFRTFEWHRKLLYEQLFKKMEPLRLLK